MIKHKKLTQAILQLKDNNDVMQTNQKAIADVFVQYYENLLGKKEKKTQRASGLFFRNGYVFDIEQQIRQVKPYTTQEVKKAMFGIDINKSPGSDDMGVNSLEQHGL